MLCDVDILDKTACALFDILSENTLRHDPLDDEVEARNHNVNTSSLFSP